MHYFVGVKKISLHTEKPSFSFCPTPPLSTLLVPSLLSEWIYTSFLTRALSLTRNPAHLKACFNHLSFSPQSQHQLYHSSNAKSILSLYDLMLFSLGWVFILRWWSECQRSLSFHECVITIDLISWR